MNRLWRARTPRSLRAPLLAALQCKLVAGAKSVWPTLATVVAWPHMCDGFAIDPAKVEADAKFEGVFAREVEWAVATRFRADRDLVVIANSQGSKLDPSARDGVGAKMGIDATVPLDAPAGKFTRIRVPGEESVDLPKVLDASVTDWRRAI